MKQKCGFSSKRKQKKIISPGCYYHPNKPTLQRKKLGPKINFLGLKLQS